MEFLVWIPPFIPIILNEKYKLFRGIQGRSLHQLLRISLTFLKAAELWDVIFLCREEWIQGWAQNEI